MLSSVKWKLSIINYQNRYETHRSWHRTDLFQIRFRLRVRIGAARRSAEGDQPSNQTIEYFNWMIWFRSFKVDKIETCIGKEGTIELPVLHEHTQERATENASAQDTVLNNQVKSSIYWNLFEYDLNFLYLKLLKIDLQIGKLITSEDVKNRS